MEEIISKNVKIVVIGVSRDRSKFGTRIFYTLLDNGYDVYGLGRQSFDERIDTSFERFKDFDVAIMVIPPSSQQEIIDKLLESNIRIVWFQPGSEWEEGINKLRNAGKIVVYGKCIVKDHLNLKFSF